MSVVKNSAHQFLDEVYRVLGYQDGTLLDAVQIPQPDSKEAEHWIENGDWLATAEKVGAEKIFFVNNEPVIIFSAFEQPINDHKIFDTLRRVWCMARPQRFFLSLPGELRVYDLNQPPITDDGKYVEPLITTTHHIVEVLEKLNDYRREQLEAGYLPENERLFGKPGERADRRLIQDLRTVRRSLKDSGLELRFAHALIGRSIFIRYLEDRRILTEKYFRQVAENHPDWMILLEKDLERPEITNSVRESELKKLCFYEVLLNKDFTYALFEQLAEDFNGDLFPKDDEEKQAVQPSHLELLRGFLLGYTDQNQLNLFFWIYDFEIIPIELISSIYEEFYHKNNENDSTTHYTPSVLVEFMLSHLLPEQRLSITPKILDPACGSGIFLVEAFRRIVRYHIKEKGRSLSTIELREILHKQIRGIEINSGAIYVTAFSLYLALLHYQKPPDILAQIEIPQSDTKPLPHLIFDENHLQDKNYYHILFNVNTFALMDAERKKLRNEIDAHPGQTSLKKFYESSDTLMVETNSVDIIVGNPPWGFVKKNKAAPEILKAQTQAQEWCNRFGWFIGDKELSQAFIARSLSLMKTDGECGFLVSTGIFFKGHSNSQKFRQRWLSESTIKCVVNFAHVREIFFNDAISPFAFVHYKASPSDVKHRIHYWSAKRIKIVEDTQSVVLSLTDFKQVRQSDLVNDEQLWKVYWWGNHRDAALINVLNLDGPLEKIIDKDEKGKSFAGRGFEGDFVSGDHNPSDWLKKHYKELPIERFQRYGIIVNQDLISVPDFVHRFGEQTIYSGWRVLVKRGITQKENVHGRIESRLDDKPYCFRNSIHGVRVCALDEWQRKILIGILWSSLTRYYFFMTAGSWGTWHHEIHLSALENMPVRFPDDLALRKRILQIVDKLRSWNPKRLDLINAKRAIDKKITNQLSGIEKELDEAIFDLYELSEPERDLVLDMCETGLEFFYRNSQSKAVQSVENYPEQYQGTIHDLPQRREKQKGLEGYLWAFLDMWNDELEPGGEFRWRVIRPSNNPMMAVVFTSQDKGNRLPELISPDKEWSVILEKIDRASQQRMSQNIYLDGIVRGVTDTEIFIIKRNERRFWTRSLAREDAEATLLQATYLQAAAREQ